jgi:hypothetical protein
LGTKLLFTATGLESETHRLQISQNWSAHQLAVAAFTEFQKSNPKHLGQVDGVSAIWLTSMKATYEHVLRLHGQEIIRTSPSNILTSAIFMGLDDAGQIDGQVVNITFDQARLEQTGEPVLSVDEQAWKLPNQPLIFSMGHDEVVRGFLSQPPETQRIIEQDWLQRKRYAAAGESDPVIYGQFLIEYGETSSPPSYGIGGPVDEMELLPKTGIKWIHRKPECPVDSTAQSVSR